MNYEPNCQQTTRTQRHLLLSQISGLALPVPVGSLNSLHVRLPHRAVEIFMNTCNPLSGQPYPLELGESRWSTANRLHSAGFLHRPVPYFHPQPPPNHSTIWTGSGGSSRQANAVYGVASLVPPARTIAVLSLLLLLLAAPAPCCSCSSCCISRWA